MKHWQRLQSRYLLKDEWLTVRADQCRLPNGREIEPYYVLEEEDWVQVVALNDDKQVITIRQYRHGAAVVCTELPGGTVDAGESPLQAAQRELREETGYDAREWNFVGALYANPARQTNRMHVFLARGLSEAGPQMLDDTEEIEVSFVDVQALGGLIQSGQFSQSMHVAALYLCSALLAE